MTLKESVLARLQQFRLRLESLPPSACKIPEPILSEHNSLVEQYQVLRNADVNSLRAKATDSANLLVTKIEAMISELDGNWMGS